MKIYSPILLLAILTIHLEILLSCNEAGIPNIRKVYRPTPNRPNNPILHIQNSQQTKSMLVSIIAYKVADPTIEIIKVTNRPISVIAFSLQPESSKAAGSTLQEKLTVSQKLSGRQNYHYFTRIVIKEDSSGHQLLTAKFSF